MIPGDESHWAATMFASCVLGDERRRKRLVQYLSDQARHAGASTASACEGDQARLQGAYRLLHNKHFATTAIEEAAFAYTIEQASKADTVLAIEDTTSLSFSHQVREELGEISAHVGRYGGRGFHAHSVLLLNATDGHIYGLAEQLRWVRASQTRGKRNERNKRNRQRSYQQKESYKWYQATLNLRKRVEAIKPRVISVCDREADIYEYLQQKQHAKERFIVRSAYNRLLIADSPDASRKLYDALTAAPVLGSTTIEVAQRGGRSARKAKLRLSSVSCTLKPTRRSTDQLEPLPIDAVLAEEINPNIAHNNRLRWILLTSEPVTDYEHVLQVIMYYQHRWKIEQFHQAWKSGCKVEYRRLQDTEALKRLSVLLGLIAVRLLQLQQWKKAHPEAPCSEILSQSAWQMLWLSTMTKSPPQTSPDIAWAYTALAKLGGFYDSKRTGRPGWSTIWKGWQRLSERTQALELAAKHLSKNK